jgi:hypothetical protein
VWEPGLPRILETSIAPICAKGKGLSPVTDRLGAWAKNLPSPVTDRLGVWAENLPSPVADRLGAWGGATRCRGKK